MQKVIGWCLVFLGGLFVIWGTADLSRGEWPQLGRRAADNPADDPLFGLIFGAKIALGVTLIYTGLTLAGVIPPPERDWLKP